jgi:Cu/Ag efflux protein CusF
MLKKGKDRLLTRAAQKHTCVFATRYRAATVKERSPRRLFQHPVSDNLLAIFCFLVLAVIAAAHGGEVHVQGTVTEISGTSVTVKTTAGKIVEVGLDAKTTYLRAKKTIPKSEIKAGDRIVVHAAEVNQKLTARTVQLGTAGGNPKSSK